MPLPIKKDIQVPLPPSPGVCGETVDCPIKFTLPQETKDAIANYVTTAVSPLEAAGLMTDDLRKVKDALVKGILDNVAVQTAHLHFAIHGDCDEFAKIEITCSETGDKSDEKIEKTKEGEPLQVPYISIETFCYEKGDQKEKDCGPTPQDGRRKTRKFVVNWYVRFQITDPPGFPDWATKFLLRFVWRKLVEEDTVTVESCCCGKYPNPRTTGKTSPQKSD
jgi:hypothetical protein